MRLIQAAIAAIAVLALILVSAPASDADLSITGNGTGSFDTFSGGSIYFDVRNTAEACTIDVTVTENGKVIKEMKGVAIAEGLDEASTTRVNVNLSDYKTEGTHRFTVKCVGPNGVDFTPSEYTTTVDVAKNVLSNWTTYVVIIVAVIAIAIIIFIKMREKPKKKMDMTFEQLEAERAAKKAAKKAPSQPAPSTERKRYLSEKKKKE
jgi:preprotein translocase subunit SecG